MPELNDIPLMYVSLLDVNSTISEYSYSKHSVLIQLQLHTRLCNAVTVLHCRIVSSNTV